MLKPHSLSSSFSSQIEPCLWRSKVFGSSCLIWRSLFWRTIWLVMIYRHQDILYSRAKSRSKQRDCLEAFTITLIRTGDGKESFRNSCKKEKPGTIWLNFLIAHFQGNFLEFDALTKARHLDDAYGMHNLQIHLVHTNNYFWCATESLETFMWADKNCYRNNRS